MHGLIDGDLIAFRCAATAEHEEEYIAHARVRHFLDRLLHETGVETYEVWFSGKNNFRYDLFPEYKANRIGGYRPKWEESTKQFLADRVDAKWFENAEADDALAIRQTELKDESIIISIDKDMRQVPGWHYSWELTRNEVVTRPAEKVYVSPEEGLRNFYTQLVVGDTADGIPGCPGKGKKAATVLQDLHTEQEMFETVRAMYDCDEAMLLMGQVLWLWRYPDNVWKGHFEQGMDTGAP